MLGRHRVKVVLFFDLTLELFFGFEQKIIFPLNKNTELFHEVSLSRSLKI